MFFATKLFTVFLAASSVVTSALAEPAPVALEVRSPGSGAAVAIAAKRQDGVEAQVFNVFTVLSETLIPHQNAIKEQAAAGTVTFDSVSPELEGIKGALDTAAAELAAIAVANPLFLIRRGLIPRQSGDELSELVAGIVIALLEALVTLVDYLAEIPLLAGLLLGIDTSLALVLTNLGLLLASVLVLVANLLVNVAALLFALAFDLTIGVIGLGA